MPPRLKAPALGKTPRLAKVAHPSNRIPLPAKIPSLHKVSRGQKIPSGLLGPHSKAGTGEWTTLLVVPLTVSIEQTISPVQGKYPIETLLRLRVIASHPGWDLELACTDLRLEGGSIGDEIETDEILLLAPTGDEFPLEDPVDVIQGGDACDRVFEFKLAVHTDEFLEIGEYEGEIVVASEQPPEFEREYKRIPLTVKVEINSEFSIRDNKTYFHFGRPGVDQTAFMQGNVKSNSPLSLSLTVSDGQMNRMPLCKPFGTSSQIAPDSTIPLEWKFGEGQLGDLRPPDSILEGGKSLNWIVNGTPGELPYRIECKAKPEASQPPGDYGMKVCVELVPVL